MKKRIALIMAGILCLSLSGTASASEINENSDPKQAETRITTAIKPTYAVSIPEDVTVTFNETTTGFGSVKLTAAQIEPGYAVKVKLETDHALVNAADQNKTIPYAIWEKDTDEAFTSGEYQTAGDSTALAIHITQAAWDAAYAGEYSGAVTFTISYEKAAP